MWKSRKTIEAGEEANFACLPPNKETLINEVILLQTSGAAFASSALDNREDVARDAVARADKMAPSLMTIEM